MIDSNGGPAPDFAPGWTPSAEEEQLAAQSTFDVTFGVSTDGGKLTFTLDDKGGGAVRHAEGQNPALVVPRGESRTFVLRLSDDWAWEYDSDPELKDGPARFKKAADAAFYKVTVVDPRTISIVARSTTHAGDKDPAGIQHVFNLYVALAQASGGPVRVRIDPIADNPPPWGP